MHISLYDGIWCVLLYGGSIEMNRQYYVAIILYQSLSDAPEYTPMYEESVVLVKAVDEDEARQKTELFAKNYTAQFKNEKGQLITWKMHQIIDVSPMLDDDIGDMTEIYARHFDNIDAYRDFEVLYQ